MFTRNEAQKFAEKALWPFELSRTSGDRRTASEQAYTRFGE
jgi:hypothetical protein